MLRAGHGILQDFVCLVQLRGARGGVLLLLLHTHIHTCIHIHTHAQGSNHIAHTPTAHAMDNRGTRLARKRACRHIKAQIRNIHTSKLTRCQAQTHTRSHAGLSGARMLPSCRREQQRPLRGLASPQKRHTCTQERRKKSHGGRGANPGGARGSTHQQRPSLPRTSVRLPNLSGCTNFCSVL